MGFLTDGLDDLQKRADEIAEQEALIHESYLLDLLKKHMLEPERHKVDLMETMNPREYLERLGYQVERMAVKLKDGSTGYEYRLYKLIDTSPKYKIKHVVPVEVTE